MFEMFGFWGGGEIYVFGETLGSPHAQQVFAEETYKELCERISRNCKLPYLNKTTTNLGERLQVRLQTSSRKVCIHECGYPASMY